MNKHYTLEEILKMENADEHISSCSLCMVVKKKEFLNTLKKESIKLNKLKNELFSIERSKEILKELEETSPSLRIPKIIKKNYFSPYLILEICKKIKMLYFSSPAKAKNWLNIALFILKNLEEKEEKNINFAKGSLFSVSGNLNIFEGKLKEALDNFDISFKIFEKEKDDFKKSPCH